jgi:hypothetical protein
MIFAFDPNQTIYQSKYRASIKGKKKNLMRPVYFMGNEIGYVYLRGLGETWSYERRSGQW